jgi:hypothetical protein
VKKSTQNTYTQKKKPKKKPTLNNRLKKNTQSKTVITIISIFGAEYNY